MPGLADRAGPGVLRAGRRALTGEPVAGVEPPQAAISIDPAVLVTDDDRCPLDVSTRADGPAIPTRVVDERHAEGPLRPRGEVARIGLGERVPPEPPQEVERATDVPLAGERQQHDVLAALEIGRVRPGTRIDHRMPVDRFHPRVVPAASEVVALLVVRGGAEPGRLDRAVVEGLADDEALLEVGLVVVGALERRAPVVHRVEEHVVQDDPPILAHDPAVVDDPRVLRPDRVVSIRRRGGRAARDPATKQQRRDQAGIDQPGGETHPREAAGRREPLVLRARLPAPELERVERLGDEAQELGLARRRIADGGEPLEVELAGRDRDPRLAQGRTGQQVACLHVRGRRHREEQLAVREAEDRLMAPEEVEIRRVAHEGATGPRSASRTSRWLR